MTSACRRPAPPRLLLAAALAAALLAAVAAIPTSDFVILGGGTAGCTVAAIVCNKLPKASITVIERGAPRTPRVRRLSLAARYIVPSWSEPALTQSFDSAPNRGLNGRKMGVLLGANIGGSSAVNAARFTLPPPWYFNTLGVDGLNAKASFSLFNRVRSALNPTIPASQLLSDYSWTWVNAAARTGLNYNSRPLDNRGVAGAWPEHIAFDSAGRRVDSYRGFLKPAMAGACRGRVRVVRGATVQTVKFKNGRATSAVVRFGGGKTATATARREILLAAGAVNTVAILQRSGVGPKALLNRFGIPVVRNLPVGTKVQTRHVTALTATYTSKLARTNDKTLLKKPWVTATFDAGKGGPLGVAAYGPAARLPGLGYLAMRIGFEGGAQGRKRLGTTSLVNPQWNSYGSVKIRSRDAAVHPEVNMNLMSSAADMKRSVTMTKRVREIFKELEKPMGVKEILRKGETTSNMNNAAVLEEKIRSQSYGTNHYAGGAETGNVLDSRLRVKSLKGLRVVDAGALRRIPVNAGPLGTVYILAVRAADIIAEDNSDLK